MINLALFLGRIFALLAAAFQCGFRQQGFNKNTHQRSYKVPPTEQQSYSRFCKNRLNKKTNCILSCSTCRNGFPPPFVEKLELEEEGINIGLVLFRTPGRSLPLLDDELRVEDVLSKNKVLFINKRG